MNDFTKRNDNNGDDNTNSNTTGDNNADIADNEYNNENILIIFNLSLSLSNHQY